MTPKDDTHHQLVVETRKSTLFLKLIELPFWKDLLITFLEIG
jgi:hypothetical protein